MPTIQRAPWREKMHEVIFEADTRAGQVFDIGLLFAIIFSVLVVSLETVESIERGHARLLHALEWTFTILFTIEYALRLVCIRRPLRYALSFYGVVDLISFLPAYLGLLTGGVASFAVVRSLRLLRVFRVLKLIHLTSESDALAGAVWRARSKIVVFLAVVFITVTIAGTAMYEVERMHNTAGTQFSSIPQAIYWAIVTMTTVGYGDIVPQTPLGKSLAAALILVGYSLIIVPTGFVAAEVIDARTRTTQVCPSCIAEGHLPGAVYCHQCGESLQDDDQAT